MARFGRVLSAGVRGSRSAEKLLSNRVAWLLEVTVIVILAASRLLYIFADYPSYFDALYEAALATVTGSGFSTDTVFVRVLHVVLAIFSVVVVATLAGTLGAFFLRRDPASENAPSPEVPWVIDSSETSQALGVRPTDWNTVVYRSTKGNVD